MKKHTPFCLLAALCLLLSSCSTASDTPVKSSVAFAYSTEEALVIQSLNGNTVTLTTYDSEDEHQLHLRASLLPITSDDGKHVVFADNITVPPEHADNPRAPENPLVRYCTLVHATTDGKTAPHKIAEKVSAYFISTDGKIITYITHDGMLYQSDVKGNAKAVGALRAATSAQDIPDEHNISDSSSQRLAPCDLCVSPDGKRMIYMTDIGEYYYAEYGKEPQLIGSCLASWRATDASLSQFYFLTADNVLYTQKGYGKRRQIDTGVMGLAAVYEDGSLYYSKPSATVMAVELIENDLPATAPINPGDKPVRADYDSAEDYQAAKELYYAYHKYRRHQSVYELAKETPYHLEYTLYYHDGSRAEAVTTLRYTQGCDTAPLVVGYGAFPDTADAYDKIPLSELGSTEHFVSHISNWLEEQYIGEATAEKYLFYKTEKSAAEQLRGADDFAFSEDGSRLVYTIDADPLDTADGNTYCANIQKGKLGDATLLVEGATDVYGTFMADGTYVCGSGIAMYIGGEWIEGDVVDGYTFNRDKTTLLYEVKNDDIFTLMQYTCGKESITVAEDIVGGAWGGTHSFFAPDGTACYVMLHRDADPRFTIHHACEEPNTVSGNTLYLHRVSTASEIFYGSTNAYFQEYFTRFTTFDVSTEE